MRDDIFGRFEQGAKFFIDRTGFRLARSASTGFVYHGAMRGEMTRSFVACHRHIARAREKDQLPLTVLVKAASRFRGYSETARSPLRLRVAEGGLNIAPFWGKPLAVSDPKPTL